jgi:hypothetical protein
MIYANIIISSKIIFFKERGFIDLISIESHEAEDKLPTVYLDRFGAENSAPLDYFYNNTNSIFDRSPIADQDLYSCLIDNSQYIKIISSTYSPQKNLNFFDIILNDDYLVRTYSVDLDYLKNDCDIRNYIVNPKTFRNYSDIVKTCNVSNPPSSIINAKLEIFVYIIPNTLHSLEKPCSMGMIDEFLSIDDIQDYKSYIK